MGQLRHKVGTEKHSCILPLSWVKSWQGPACSGKPHPGASVGLWAAPPLWEGSGGCHYSWINSQVSSPIVGKFFQQTNISLTPTVGWANTATWGSMLTHISYTKSVPQEPEGGVTNGMRSWELDRPRFELCPY